MGYPKLVTDILRVRLFRPDDAAATLQVFREAVRRSAARDYTLPQIAAWAPNLIDLSAWTERRSSRTTWVAERDGGVPTLHTEASITALPVFVHRGFQMIAAQTVELRGETFTNYRMEKRLDDPAAGA